MLSYQDSAEIVNFGIAIYSKEKKVFLRLQQKLTRKRSVFLLLNAVNMVLKCEVTDKGG